MLSKLFDVVTRRPDLLVDHAIAYVNLAQREFSETRDHVLRRLVAGVIAVVLVSAFIILCGVTAILGIAGVIAVTPAVLSVPGVVLLAVIAACWYAKNAGAEKTRSDLRVQLTDDLVLLRELAGAKS